MDLVQDRAKTGQRLATRADTAVEALATPGGRVTDASVPMGVDPATFVPLDNTGANTGQVKSGNRDNQEQALQGFRRRELTGMELIAA